MHACMCVCVCVLSDNDNIIIVIILLSTYMHMFCTCRLLMLNYRYYDLLWTLIYLAPKMATVAIFLVLIYYVYAIVGVEFLNGTVFEGCW